MQTVKASWERQGIPLRAQINVWLRFPSCIQWRNEGEAKKNQRRRGSFYISKNDIYFIFIIYNYSIDKIAPFTCFVNTAFKQKLGQIQ